MLCFFHRSSWLAATRVPICCGLISCAMQITPDVDQQPSHTLHPRLCLCWERGRYNLCTECEFRLFLVSCWLNIRTACEVYPREGSAQTVVLAATLEPTPLRDKLYGTLEEPRRTAAFVRAIGIPV